MVLFSTRRPLLTCCLAEIRVVRDADCDLLAGPGTGARHGKRMAEPSARAVAPALLVFKANGALVPFRNNVTIVPPGTGDQERNHLVDVEIIVELDA
eukprot:9201530-Lingulodinium_polyedra.AAC.1